MKMLFYVVPFIGFDKSRQTARLYSMQYIMGRGYIIFIYATLCFFSVNVVSMGPIRRLRRLGFCLFLVRLLGGGILFLLILL